MMWPQRTPDGRPVIPPTLKYLSVRDCVANRFQKPRAWPHNDCGARHTPDRKVFPAVPDVIKVLALNKVLNGSFFSFPGEIRHTVAGQYKIEKAQMSRDRRGDLRIGAGRQNQLPALGFLFAQIFNDLPIE